MSDILPSVPNIYFGVILHGGRVGRLRIPSAIRVNEELPDIDIVSCADTVTIENGMLIRNTHCGRSYATSLVLSEDVLNSVSVGEPHVEGPRSAEVSPVVRKMRSIEEVEKEILEFLS